MARPTSPRASGSVLPSSRVISRATWSARDSRIAAARCRISPRLGAGTAAHAGCAALAASIACRASSASDFWKTPTTSSVSAGLRVSKVAPVCEAVHSPPIRFLKGVIDPG